ncbi:cardiolipin synthase [Chitinophaga niabensis]|uniref:Cardiolipin synthase n=1 Tax=Chitinophaga niabensis TaxID=536979 RepID=A0A1N6FDJ5_9BACT|nr:cardiolipin synthase [Chitinophaga niabensis]SIN93338.1 cardiolipin synthase [Chitinophaga niabensis]
MILQFLKDHWQTISIIILYGITAWVAVKALLEARSTGKTLAYLLVLFFLPGIGVLIYLLVGMNRRVNRIYSRKWMSNVRLSEKLQLYLQQESRQTLIEHSDLVTNKTGIARLLFRDSLSPITADNEAVLLLNGEEKFPLLVETLKAAKHHIHLEYYIFEEDVIGREIMDILMQKAKEGVEVRFIYDDFGSSDINRRFLRQMRAAGIEVYPFYRVRLLANRLNYRNHRKIVVIDGHTGFIGGINVADRYINSPRYRDAHPQWPYWRDTHLCIKGLGVHTLQFLFMGDWNFCAEADLPITQDFFPDIKVTGEDLVQIAASGPDSERSSIMLSYLAAINQAERSVYITTPYFIPNESILNALQMAALSGRDVRLLVPDKSDSRIVNKASESFFEALLTCGVRIFRYQKGFVHAKTMVVDENLSVVGTANMDIRSFDFNFEVNAFVYSKDMNWKLTEAFLQDTLHSTELHLEQWRNRGRMARLGEAIVRLFSPLL